MNYERLFEKAVDGVRREQRYRVFADLERPITAACALETGAGFETAAADALAAP